MSQLEFRGQCLNGNSPKLITNSIQSNENFPINVSHSTNGYQISPFEYLQKLISLL